MNVIFDETDPNKIHEDVHKNLYLDIIAADVDHELSAANYYPFSNTSVENFVDVFLPKFNAIHGSETFMLIDSMWKNLDKSLYYNKNWVHYVTNEHDTMTNFIPQLENRYKNGTMKNAKYLFLLTRFNSLPIIEIDQTRSFSIQKYFEKLIPTLKSIVFI